MLLPLEQELLSRANKSDAVVHSNGKDYLSFNNLPDYLAHLGSNPEVGNTEGNQGEQKKHKQTENEVHFRQQSWAPE